MELNSALDCVWFLSWIAESKEELWGFILRYSDPPTDAGNYSNEQDEVGKVGKNPRFGNIGYQVFFTTLVGLDVAFTGVRFSRWVAQSREELTRLLLRYSNYATDVGTYLSEQDEMGKVGKKRRDTDTVLVTLQNLDLLSTSLTSPWSLRQLPTSVAWSE